MNAIISKTTFCVFIFVAIQCLQTLEAQTNKIFVSVNDKQLEIHIPDNLITNFNMVEDLIAQRLRGEIVDSSIHNAGITVPEEILSNCTDLYFATGGVTTKDAEIMNQKCEALVNALKDVVITNKNMDEVYNDQLRALISIDEWKIWASQYNTKDKIDTLETVIPHSLQEMKQRSQSSLKREIKLWLLFNKLCKNIKPSSNDVASVYKEMYPSGQPSLETIKEKMQYLAAIEVQKEYFKQWWQRQIDKQNVNVPEQYQNVTNLINIAPSPLLPKSVIKYLQETQ